MFGYCFCLQLLKAEVMMVIHGGEKIAAIESNQLLYFLFVRWTEDVFFPFLLSL